MSHPSYSRPHPSQALPLELWREIFRFAIHVPGNDEVFLVDFFDLNCILNAVELDVDAANRQSRDIQLAIILVCRTWRDLAIELVYEYLRIESPERLSKLVRVLEASKGYTPRGHGWWTTRVGVHYSPEPDGLEPFARDLARLLACCPNVAVFVSNHELEVQTPTETMLSLGRACGRSLRRLEWHRSEVQDTAELTQLLRECPAIEVLMLSGVVNRASDAAPASTSSVSPPLSLHNLSCVFLKDESGDLLSEMESWDIPALSRLTVSIADSACIPPLQSFLKVHGHKLVYLVQMHLDMQTTEEYWTKLLPYCTSLQDFFYTPDEVGSPFALKEACPSLRQVGVCVDDPGDDDRDWSNILDRDFNHLAGENFRGLKTIRIFSDVPFEELHSSDVGWWSQWLKKWRKKGVKVDDSFGGELTIPGGDHSREESEVAAGQVPAATEVASASS